MAWIDKAKLGTTMAAFEKQIHRKGNMPGPTAMLHPVSMKPRGQPIDMGSTKGNGPGFGAPTAGGLGGKVETTSVQSPAQHRAVQKAAAVSAARRKKIL